MKNRTKIFYLIILLIVTSFPYYVFSQPQENEKEPITRANIAILLARAIDVCMGGISIENLDMPFPPYMCDVNNAWGPYADVHEMVCAYESIVKLHERGIIEGFQGQFKPRGTMTRYEFSIIMARLMQALRVSENFSTDNSDTCYFKDVRDVHWAYEAIIKTCELGIFRGYPDGTFKGTRKVTVSEARSVIKEMISKLVEYKDKYLNIHLERGNYLPGEEVTFLISGNTGDIHFTLYKIDYFSFLKDSPASNILTSSPGAYGKIMKHEFFYSTVNTVKKKSFQLSSGYYLAELSSGSLQKKLFFGISNLGFAAKYTPGELLLMPYFKNEEIGNKEGAYDVLITDSGKIIYDGGLTGDMLKISKDIPQNAMILVRHEEDMALLYAYQIQFLENTPPPRLNVYLYTDRPIYRPGQTVHFKGMSFDKAYTGFFLQLYNPFHQTIFEKEYKPSAFNTFAGDFPLGDDIPLGTYYFRVSVPQNNATVKQPALVPVDFGFDVQEYQKKDFAITLVSEKSTFEPKDKKIFEVYAYYLFGKPMHDMSVHYEIYRYSKREREDTVDTNKDGKASINLSDIMQEGDYSLLVKIQDKAGGASQTSQTFSIRHTYPQIVTIKTNTESYFAGDHATIYISARQKIGNAFFSIEGNKLFILKKIQIPENSLYTEEIEIKEEYYPGIMLTLSWHNPERGTGYGYGKETVPYFVATKKIPVRRKTEHFVLDVATTKDTYEPREDARFVISAKDGDGKPVIADLSMGLVDKSIYALKKEREFLPFVSSPNIVRTGFSWNVIWDYTNMPRSYCSWGVVYALTASTEEKEGAYIEKIEAKEQENKPIFVRSYFPDTAYWNASIFTDEKGKAEISFPLPDTLTTWTATVKGINQDLAYVNAVKEITTQKKVIVRLIAPPFFTDRDEIEISTIAHNYSNKDIKTKIELSALGAELLSSKAQELIIPKDGYAEQTWKLKVNSSLPVILSATITGGKNYDIMRKNIPVVSHGMEAIQNVQGTLSSKESKTLALPEFLPENTTEVKLFLSSPYFPSGLLSSLHYLIDYPYGCIEQTMSKFFPLVSLANLYTTIGFTKDTSLNDKMHGMVYSGLQRIYSFQNADGGWGWWKGDSDPYITSYVMYGLSTAKENYFVNGQVLQKGLSFLEKTAEGTKVDSKKVLPAFILALYKKEPPSFVNTIGVEKLDLWEKAMLAMAYKNFNNASKAEQLIQDVENNVTVLNSYVSYDRFINQPLEYKALILLALLKLHPDSQLVFPLIEELLSARKGNFWVSTKTTAIVLLSYAEFLRKYYKNESNPIQIFIDGKSMTTFDLNSRLLEKNKDIVVDKSDLLNAKNIIIENKGENTVFYDLSMLYFTKEENISAGGKGIQIKKTINDSGVVTVNFSIKEPLERVVLEDFLPSCCEVDLNNLTKPSGFMHFEKRDNRLVFFFQNLNAGNYAYSYMLKKIFPGKFHAMPAIIYPMYAPDVRGNSNEILLEYPARLLEN